MIKQFTLTSPWGDNTRNYKIKSMLAQGYIIKYHWHPEVVGGQHIIVFVKEK